MLEPLIIFVFGLIIGSFCNVVIYRLPQGRSIVSPGSRCRSCDTFIRPWDNIPLLSYVLLKGRCRFCKEPISLRYPAVESLNGALYAMLYLKFGLTMTFAVYAVLTSALVIVAFIDFDHKIIPNTMTLPGMAVGLGLSLGVSPITPPASLIGLISGGAIFYLIALISGGGMGGGDIKLIAMIGAFLGLPGVLFTIFVSALSGSVVGVMLMLLGRKGRKDRVPFGPFLAFGAILYMLVGNDLIQWYLDLVA
jgi:leader peptidase (prepilin peptidase) / N-methyltransferase